MYIITDILNKEPEQPVGAIFKNRFSETKGNLQEKIKKMTRSGFDLKRKRKSKKVQSRGKRRKVKLFSQRNNRVLKVGA